LKKGLRLTGRRDFQRLLSSRRLYAGQAIVGFAAPGRAAAGNRVGVGVSRQIKGAVARNRARRRLREALRLRLENPDSRWSEAGITFDMVVIARPATLEMSFSELEAEAGRFLRRLHAGSA